MTQTERWLLQRILTLEKRLAGGGGGGGSTPMSRQIISGAGLTGGGDLSADRTLAVGAGVGITVNADDVALSGILPVLSADPGAPTNGTAWLLATGTTPTRALALRIRDGGVTYTIAEITI